jgi:threonine dehydratase
MQNSPADLTEVGRMVMAAQERIAPFVLHTPLLRVKWLDGPDSQVWIKLECWQRTGSFKARGAYNAIVLSSTDREVFTASAGNHGLAIATASAELARSCQILVPESASELKIRRIKATGARVVPVGRDLFESCDYARARAAEVNGNYVSAYDNWNVVAGQGTCAIECLRDLPDVSSIVLPLGGGGLAVGVAGAVRVMRPEVRVFAAHPALFGRSFPSSDVRRQLSTAIVPSIADGLAVQVDIDGDVAGHVESAVADIWSITEDEIKTAIFAMLHLEGILLEGAGAIAIAALMTPERMKHLHGHVVVLATGRNISSSDVGRALGAPVREPRIRELLGLRHVQAAMQLASAPTTVRGPSRKFHDPAERAVSTGVDWVNLLESLSKEAAHLHSEIRRHRQYAERRNLRLDSLCSEAIDAQLELCVRIAREFAQAPGPPWSQRARYRLVLQQIGYIKTFLEWASPAHDQSLETGFFDPAEQASAAVNYARYGTPRLRAFELNLRNALGFDASAQELLATSSGMASYQVFEAFLLRDVLLPGDTIAYAPYVYFEAREHLRRLPGFRHMSLASFEVERILSDVEREDPHVIFLDPLANCPGLPTIDLRDIANRTRDGSWRNRWIVIDGTMVSGGLDPFSWFDSAAHPRILYYESASKYLQLGMDLQMAGVCVFDADLLSNMYLYRRNCGSTMYSAQVARFPRYDRETLLDRMRLLSRNAGLIARALCSISSRVGGLTVGFPMTAGELGWQHAGGVVSAEFTEFERNSRASLGQFIEILLAECRARGVPITTGVSFGFAVTRVSAASALAEGTDPFLRFSAGEESREEMDALCECIQSACITFAESAAA